MEISDAFERVLSDNVVHLAGRLSYLKVVSSEYTENGQIGLCKSGCADWNRTLSAETRSL